MPVHIIKLNSHYLEWSTVRGAPATISMTLEDFKKYYLAKYGQDSYRRLDERLVRVERYGTSCLERYTPQDIMRSNQAGPHGCQLTPDEIYRAYCLGVPIRNGWSASEGQIENTNEGR